MGVPITDKLRLARIGFLNVLPIFHPLEAGIVPHPFEMVTGTPAVLNEKMARGELDLGVVSSIEYARRHDQYFILPDLSISCLGSVQSVLLLSRVPFNKLAGSNILVTAQSHTSVALLKVLMQLRHGMQCRYEAGLCTRAIHSSEPPAAMLVIGDEALKLRNHPLYPYKMDLGQEWLEWTGHPFVFAVWVIQKATVARWNGNIHGALGALSLAGQWGRAHMEDICALGARSGVLSREELRHYYQCLHYDLNLRQQKGLELFYRYVHETGELETAPSLNIYSPLACVA